MIKIPRVGEGRRAPSQGRSARRGRGAREVGRALAALLLALTAAGAAWAQGPAAGAQGMVASNHPLASLAGMQVLVDGGNAVDAAVAMAAALGVVEPYSSGAGGDGFMVVYWAEEDAVHALNFSGRAPRAADPAAFAEAGRTPNEGPQAAVVPGAVAGWDAALERFGSLPLERILAPAIAYAEEGYALSAYGADAQSWAIAPFLEWGEIGAQTWWGGEFGPPGVGDRIRNPNLAATYRTLAEEGLDAFYRGAVAERLVAAVQEHGGLLAAEDFAAYEVAWEAPLRSDYRGHEVYTVGPNSSGGVAVAQILNLLEGFDVAALEPNGAEHVHLFVEATKLAAADRAAWITDPDFATELPLDELLSDAYAEARRAEIDPERAATDVEAGRVHSGTSHVSVVDRDGNMVSMTVSLGFGWGSGFVAGDTGVVLNNALHMFELDPASPVALEGGKRPRWNMAPLVLIAEDGTRAVLGTPGGTSIWQVLPQVVSRMVDHGLGLQAAIDAPRFTWSLNGPAIGLEARIEDAVLDELAAMGHEPSAYTDWSLAMGGVNGIVVHADDGRLEGGRDPRREGYVMGW